MRGWSTTALRTAIKPPDPKHHAYVRRRDIVSCMDLARILGMTDDARRARAERLTDAVRKALQDEAPNVAYRDSITSRMVEGMKGEVTLSAPGLFLEHGQAPRDMREQLLRSPKTKTSPTTGNRYLQVPMKDGIRTASSNGRPWYTRARSGVGGIVHVRARMRDLIVMTRRGAP